MYSISGKVIAEMTPEQIDALLDMSEVKDKITQGLPIYDIMKDLDRGHPCNTPEK